MSPALFGQPGVYGGNAPFGYEPGQAGMGQNQFSLSPLGHNPLLSSFAGYAGAHNPAQQIVLVLGQLAQQISVQSALIQQISIALQQLVHQGGGLGAGQAFAGAGQPFIGAGQYFSPQAQAWGANRAQTIQ